MLFVALAALGALIVVVFALLGVIRSQQRAHARREDLLLNQLLHATGKPWQEPPVAASRRVEREREPEPRGWTATPEQQPVN